MSGTSIAIVGGGVFAVKLCRTIAAHGALSPGEIRLMALRYERLCVVAEECQRIVDEVGPGWKVRASRSLADGCAGADVIVLLVRQGGLAARARDEAFPRAFGNAGDEGLGPGGMANALRTIPALRKIAQVIEQSAPDAWILNMVAPLGVTTRFLLDFGLRTIGVCELPSVTERRLLDGVRLPQPMLRYAGFNHWGWFWADDERGAEIIQASVEAGLADGETVAAFHAVPLRYYYEIFWPGKAEELGFRRSPSRAYDLNLLSESIFDSFPIRTGDKLAPFAGRPTPWFDEALVPMIAALKSGEIYHGFANVRNGSRLPMVAGQVVVELRARISGDCVETVAGGAPPDRVGSFLAMVGRSEDFVYRAATANEPNERVRAIASAIEALPLPDMSGKVEDLVNEIISAGVP